MSDAVSERPTFYRKWLSPEGYLGLHLAVGFVLALMAGWAFAALAEDVLEVPGGLPADHWAHQLVDALNGPRLTRIMRTITFVGKAWVLTVLSLGVAAWLLAVRSHRRLYAFLATMIGGALLNFLLKLYFARARPSWPLVRPPDGYSFPSGHAMGSLLFFGSLAYVLYVTVEAHHFWRVAAAVSCGAAAVAVGASRVYLGVHYLTDVIAGFCAALCWMGVCLSGTEGWVRWRDWHRRRRRRGRKARTLILAGLPLSSLVHGEELPLPPCAECIVWEATPSQAQELLTSDRDLNGLHLLVRWSASEDGAVGDLVSALARRGADPGLVLALSADGAVAVPHPSVSTVVIDARGSVAVPGAPAIVYRVKTMAIEMRARRPGLRVGAVESEALSAVAAALQPYLDFVVVRDAVSGGSGRWLEASEEAGASVLAALAASRSGADRVLIRWPDDPQVPLTVNRVRGRVPTGLTRLEGPSLVCTSAGGSAAPCNAEAFLDPRDQSAVIVLEKPAGVTGLRLPGDRATVESLSAAATPAIVVDRATGMEVDVPSPADAFLVRVEGWRGADVFASAIDVEAERPLSVEEIIARHQAAAARQHRLVTRLIATGSTTVSFQAPGLAAPVTIVSRTTLYVGRGTVEVEHRDIRLNGVAAVATGAGGVPRLPILEPERVSQPPLAIALDESYSYRLEGRERIGEHDCYRVAFWPRARAGSLHRGRAWIEARGFGLVRMAAAQTGLRGAIVAAEQRDDFVPRPVAGELVWLLARSEAHQAYEGAGHRTPIDRLVRYDDLEANPDDFELRLARAHESAAVMMRQTPQGFRYLRRLPAKAGEAPPPRVVAPPATRVRTVALGVIIDPNISTPLPFAGLSYVDFDFLGRGAQLSSFFALSFGQASWSVPSLFGSRWQLQGSAFGTVAEYNDRSFRAGREKYDENLRQRPARLALGLVRPLGTRWRARLGYELSYTRLRRADTTAADFVVPLSPLVHAARLALEVQRGSWTASAWWSPAWRQQWREWGGPEAEEPPAAAAADFQRYGVGLTRAVVRSSTLIGRVEAAWMGGQDLDRFSRYTFDAFENRLRGYPTHSVRFDTGGVARAVLTWSPAPRLRLDAFADVAVARDPGLGDRFRGYPGLGAGVEAPVPHVGLAALEWGYGFEGRRSDGGRGTHVLRLTAYRPF